LNALGCAEWYEVQVGMTRNVYRIMAEKTFGKLPLGPWVVNIKMGLKEAGCEEVKCNCEAF
jgi:hypothetical protein